MKVTVLYHYLHPDDVVSARHFSDLCEDLAAHGWEVEAMPSNRGSSDERVVYPARETWRGVSIRRVWRPGLRQATTVGRLANAAWMAAAWSTIALRRRSELPDVILVGTDPPFAIGAAALVKLLRPSVKVAHWCFDMFPEAPVAEGMLAEGSLAVRVAKRLWAASYRACDTIVDIGSCMRARIDGYGPTGRQVTLVPWALVEPDRVPVAEAEARRALFGEAKLGLLYSGKLGRAHSFEPFLSLARRLRGDGDGRVGFSFGVRGHREPEIRAAVRADDTNVSFAGFAPEEELERRLAAADVHLVSLRDESWAGIVVPSKFFGSLATGRPVVFAGPERSAVAGIIREHQVGWVLDDRSQERVAEELLALVDAPEKLAALQQRCLDVYRAHFARRHITARWDEELRRLLT